MLAINNVVSTTRRTETIRAAEEKSDMYEDRLGNYLVELSSHNPSGRVEVL